MQRRPLGALILGLLVISLGVMGIVYRKRFQSIVS